MNSGAFVSLPSALIKSNHQEGVRYHLTSPGKKQPLQDEDGRGSSLETRQSCDPSRHWQRHQLLHSLPLCDLRQVLCIPRRKTEIMGLSYFTRDLSNTSEIMGLKTYKTENYNCKAWQYRDALTVKEKKPHITREKEKQRFLLSLVMLKGSFLTLNWTEKAFRLSPGWTLVLGHSFRLAHGAAL